MLRVSLEIYKKRIWERKKREVWELELERMNNVEVFGKAYQMLRRGVRSEVVLSTKRKAGGGWTEGVVDSISNILDEMLPDDVVEEDMETQAGWRAEVMN